MDRKNEPQESSIAVLVFAGRYGEVLNHRVDMFNNGDDAAKRIIDVNEKTLRELREVEVEGSVLPKYWTAAMPMRFGVDLEARRPTVAEIRDAVAAARRKL